MLAACSVLALSVGCSSLGGDVEVDELGDVPSDPSPDGGESSGGAAGGDDGYDSAGAEPGEDPTSGGTGDADGEYREGGCAGPQPEAWIFCEDFEALERPADVFFEYHDAQGAFVLDPSIGYLGGRSMRATYQPGSAGAGWLSVSLGDNPIATGFRPEVADERTFDELYWRFRIKTEHGWPDAGPRALTRITSFAADDWSQAMLAELGSAASDVVLEARVATCVDDGTVLCKGYNDSEAFEHAGTIPGTTPIFSAERSDIWQCVEARVRLNTPGEADGVFEFWIDDEFEAGRDDLDYRGTWDGSGLNLIAIENMWTGGAPAELSRWIDDLVISTEPIGCD